MIGETFDTSQLGKRRRNWRLGCDEELRLYECETCGQQQAQYEPEHPPEHGWVWAIRCVRCGGLVYGRRDGESPLAKAEAPLNQGLVIAR